MASPPLPAAAAARAERAARRARAEAWLARDPDAVSQRQLAAWLAADDHAALRAAFDGTLAFGTAGLRAAVGPGPLGMNALVVRHAMAGLLEAVAAHGHAHLGVAIAFDGRLDSLAFARHALGVAHAANVAVDVFTRPVPTPLLGFWVKERGLAAGLMVTASHNPKADNGLKIYWHGGVQVAPPIDGDIAQAMAAVAARAAPPAFREPPAFAALGVPPAAELRDVTDSALHAYLARLGALPAPWPAAATAEPPLELAYSPLHGVGLELTRAALGEPAMASLHVVAEQAEPNGHFPTIESPNPEDPSSLERAHALGERVGATLACVHDPDADRLIVAARTTADARTRAPLAWLSGDQLGVAIAHLLLEARAGAPASVACSLVSSRVLPLLAAHHHVPCAVTLPGFKWLARAARDAAARKAPCLLAYEEALGYAPSSLVWDKDGVSMLRLCVLLARRLAAQGQTLWDALAAAQAVSALGVSCQRTVRLSPRGARAVLAKLRQGHSTPVGEWAVELIDDGRAAEASGPYAHLPPSDWLALRATPARQAPAHAQAATDAPWQRGVRIMVRPSGTEPKLKLYYEWLEDPVAADAWWPHARELAARLARLAAQHVATLAAES